MTTPSERIALDPALLEQPLMSRVQVALEAWLDRFPSTTRLRFGEDPDTKTYVLCENMHGPRMDVMTREEYRSFRSTADREDYLKGDRIALEAKNKGIHLRNLLEFDPAEGIQGPDLTEAALQGMFVHECAQAINQGLADIGCVTHRVKASGSNLAWEPQGNFSLAATPGSAVYTALSQHFKEEPLSPLNSHVTIGDTLHVQALGNPTFHPQPFHEVEQAVLNARHELQNPDHPWAKEGHANAVWAYICSKEPVPIHRNGHLLWSADRHTFASETGVGYLVDGKETSGLLGIQRDAEELIHMAENGQMNRFTWMYSHLPDLLVSYALHRQLQVHQHERAAWADQQTPPPLNPAGPTMPKPVMDLQVGDLVGVGPHSDKTLLWCEVKDRQGDIASLWVNNGHWQFDLNLRTNKTLAHAFVADFQDAASIVYTADTPIKDPALYTQALEWMNFHLSMPAPATPSLPSMD